MENYIEAEGSRSQIIENMVENCLLSKELSGLCLDFIKNNQEILSKEEFFQYSRLEEHTTEGVSEFVSESGEFYICLKKTTLFLVCLYLGSKYPGLNMAKEIAIFAGAVQLENGFVSLDGKDGKLCIMLELARRRQRGAEKSFLTSFRGECCNNHILCRFNRNGLCNCKEEAVEKICEEFVTRGIVKKKGRKYFYIL